MKICSRQRCHMVKMATMTMDGKNLSKNFFSRTARSIALKPGTQVQSVSSKLVDAVNQMGKLGDKSIEGQGDSMTFG